MPTSLLLFVTLAVLGGCAGNKLPSAWEADHYVVAVNEKGESVNPNKWPATRPTNEYDQQLVSMFASMDDWHKKYEKDHPGKPRRILIFVHGGMTEPIYSLRRAKFLRTKIEQAGYYPIFIVWNPELWTSYGEHLAWVRQGRYERKLWILAPFYLTADLGKALVSAPIVWAFQAGNDYSRTVAAIRASKHDDPKRRWVDNPMFRSAVLITDELLNEYGRAEQEGRTNAIKLSIGKVEGRFGEAPGRKLGNLIMLPVKYAVSPLLDAGGSAAWDNMYRRAQILFDGFSSSKLGSVTDPLTVLKPGKGALVKLLDELERLSPTTRPATAPAQPKYEITLVGHSMGSIVLSEFLRRSDNIEYRNIVFMAAACSVRTFQQHVIGYLSRHSACDFYNLTLHPTNDLRERNFHEIPPRGSLLVWIDDMFENPRTPLDRTLGRWENVVEASYVIPEDVRGRVNLKAFAVWPHDDLIRHEDPAKQVPQKHGQFAAASFWTEDFWRPDSPGVALQNAPEIQTKATNVRREERQQQEQRQQQKR